MKHPISCPSCGKKGRKNSFNYVDDIRMGGKKVGEVWECDRAKCSYYGLFMGVERRLDK